MKKIRTAISGLGRIGWIYHLPQLQKHPGFELTAVFDPEPDRLDEVRTISDTVKCYTSYEEMIAQEPLDLVVIASPTIFHTAQILAAFERGIDVFAEKPLAADLSETMQVIDAMEKSGRKLMVYQPRRLDADCRQAREILNSGVLGELHFIRRSLHNFTRRNDWQALKQYAGGMLNNYGVHFLDQLCSVAGFDFQCEYCELRKVNAAGDAEDCFRIILRNQAGVTGEVFVSQSCAFPRGEWLLEGNRGTARYDGETKTWQIRYILPGQLKEACMQTSLAADGRLYPHDQITWHENFEFTAPPEPEFYDNLHAYICGTAPAMVQISQTRKVMELIDRARKLDGERHGK